jgi:hypothetical protein
MWGIEVGLEGPSFSDGLNLAVFGTATYIRKVVLSNTTVKTQVG